MKVLVAEDDPSISLIIKTILQKEGYIVSVVTDGREALQMIATNPPDLLITDIMMPYTSGLELTGTVKANAQKSIDIIVLSGMGQEDIVIEAFKLGADDFLTKPFSNAELLTRVKRFAVRNKHYEP